MSHVARWPTAVLAIIGLFANCTTAFAVQDEVLNQLVQRLESDKFTERKDATRDIERIGVKAIPVLDRLQRESADAETRHRAATLIAKIRWNEKVAAPQFDWTRVKPVTEKSGRIIASEHWTSDRTYQITSNLVIPKKVQIEVEAGTIVLVDDGVSIEVEREGELIAIGAEQEGASIVFIASSANSKKPGKWGKLVSGGRVELDHVEIRDSRGVETLQGTGGAIGKLAIYDTHGDAITLRKGLGPLRYRKSELLVRNASEIGVNALSAAGFHSINIVGAKTGLQLTKKYFEAESIQVQYATEAGIRIQNARFEAHRIIIEHAAVGASVVDGTLRAGLMEVRDSKKAAVIESATFDCKRLVARDIAGDALAFVSGHGRVHGIELENIDGNGVLVQSSSNPVLYSISAKNVGGHDLVLADKATPVLEAGIRKGIAEKTVRISISDDSSFDESEEARLDRTERKELASLEPIKDILEGSVRPGEDPHPALRRYRQLLENIRIREEAKSKQASGGENDGSRAP